MRMLPFLLSLVAGLCLPCGAQRIGETYTRVELPTPHPIALAASSDYVVVSDKVGRTFVSSDLSQWRSPRNGGASPSMLWTFRDSVWGLDGSRIYELVEATEWQFRASITNLYRVREFDGRLYGLASAQFGRAAFLRSLNGINWEELSVVPDATHAYDFSLHNGQFIVTHIRGEYYTSSTGREWEKSNLGAGDRLYTSALAEDRFVIGGTDFVYVQYAPGRWDAVPAGISNVRDLIHTGGFTFAAGGSNPDQGAIAVSSNLYSWRKIPGAPIPSVQKTVRFKNTILFLSSSNDFGTLSAIEFFPLSLQIVVQLDSTRLRLESQEGFLYRFEVSADLVNWSPYGFLRPGTGATIEWFYPRTNERLFFRAVAE